MISSHRSGWFVAAAVAAVLGSGAARAQGLRIVEGASSYDANGFVHISGTIHNETGRPVCDPGVDVTLRTVAGQAIPVDSIVTATKQGLGQPAIDSVVADRWWLPAGEVAVFTYLRDRAKLGGLEPSRHELRANADPCPGPLPRIAVEGFTVRTDEVGSHHVHGTLRNVGLVPCRSPQVVLGLYGADGTLLDATSVQPDELFQKYLVPGAIVKFARPSIPDPETGRIARFATWGDCAAPE